MAPESIKDSGLSDPRSDIYAVGALACFLLTGQYVFNAESVMEIYEKQLTLSPPPLSGRSANPVSPELDQTILCCLERDAALRPQTVGELAERLRASPRAADWTSAQRADWWNWHRPLPSTAPTQPSATPATIRIEVQPRTP